MPQSRDSTVAETKNCSASGRGLAAAIRAEQVALLYDNTKAALAANALTSLLALLIILPSAPLPISAAWLMGMILIGTARGLLGARRKRNLKDADAHFELWERRMVLAAAITGAWWGLFGTLIFTVATPLSDGFAPFVLGGLVAAAIATLGPIRRAYAAFSLPILTALAVCLISRWTLESALMAGLAVAFEVVMLITVWRVSDIIRGNIELRLTNEQLVRSLTENVTNLEREVAERARAEARVQFLATHDPLTGLPNRRSQQERFDQAVVHAAKAGSQVALLFIDLDRFKEVNDSYGHPAGDSLLCQVAERLKGHLRSADAVCRQGGDEFLLMFADVPGGEAAAALAKRVSDSLAQPIHIDGQALRSSGSIGVSLYPRDGRDFDTLIRLADKALYRAKANGRAAYCFYDAMIDGPGAEHEDGRGPTR